MNQNVYKHIVSRFVLLYGEPKTHDVQGFFQEYSRALQGYTAVALEAGADRIIKTHTFKSWPTIAECREAVEDASPRPAPEYKPEPKFPASSPEQKKRVDALCKGLIGSLRTMELGERKPKLPPNNRDSWQARFGRREASS